MTAKAKATPTRISAVDAKTGRKYVLTQMVEGATVTVTKFTWKPGETGWASAVYDVTSPPPASELFAGSLKWDGTSWKVGTKTAPTMTKAVRAILGIEQLAAPKPRAAKKTPVTTGTPPPAGPRNDTISPGESAAMATAAATAAADQAGKPSRRKSAATRKAEKAAEQAAASRADADPVGSVLDSDPDTGLPRVKPEVAEKVDGIVAAQLAKNEADQAADEAADQAAQEQYESEQAAAQDAAIERITSGETTVEAEVIDILTKKGAK